MRTAIRILADWQFYLCLSFAPIVLFALSFVLTPSSPAMPLDWPRLLLFSLAYPVLEEIVFRGLLQEWLAKHLPSRCLVGLSLANILTSLIFAVAHLFTHRWDWAMSVFFPSLVFGHMKERHVSLLSPIVLHCVYNLGYFLLYR